MATLLDMLLGNGTGAITQPTPYAPAPKPSPSYQNIVSQYAKPPITGKGGIPFLTYPTGAGSEVQKSPVLTPPAMQGPAPHSTPTAWPYNANSMLSKPLAYFAGAPSIHNAPDFSSANQLTADMTGGGKAPATQALAAIEQAAPNPFSAYTARPHMALTLPPQTMQQDVLQPGGDPWAGMRGPSTRAVGPPSVAVTQRGTPRMAAPLPPRGLTGSSTRRNYNIGQTYSTKEFDYVATPQGFVKVGRAKTATKPADRPGGYKEKSSSTSSLSGTG